MKTLRASHEPSSLSFSRRYFTLRKKVEGGIMNDDDNDNDELVLTSHHSERLVGSHHETTRPLFCKRRTTNEGGVISDDNDEIVLTSHHTERLVGGQHEIVKGLTTLPRLTRPLFRKRRTAKVIGTVFGSRRGHVKIVFQEHPRAAPGFLIEVWTATGGLVREMAAGAVRVAFECERSTAAGRKKGPKLLEESSWRAYCNGNKCGPAIRGECGGREREVLAAVGPVTAGAGVLPEAGEGEGEVMYMRAVFERVAGPTKDSEAFYMVSPEGSGGPELSLFFRRV